MQPIHKYRQMVRRRGAVEFPAPEVGFGGPPAASNLLADTEGYRLRASPDIRLLQSPSRPIQNGVEALNASLLATWPS